MPDTFRQLTGIAPEAFDRLLAELEPRYQQAETKRKTRCPRQRKPGTGRKFALPLTDQLLMLLMYYRTTHAFLGFLFGIDDSLVCRHINQLQLLLARIFRIPERRAELEPDEIRELFSDATERVIPRPSRRQKRFYSGKKQRHTLKHQVVVVRRRKRPGRAGQRRRGRIAAVSRAFPDKTHDKKVHDTTGVVCLRGVRRIGHGAPGDRAEPYPAPAPARGALTARQKAGNRRVAPADRGRARDREGVVHRVRAVPEPAPAPALIKNVAGLRNLMYA